MGRLLETKIGNVFLGGDDDSNPGKTLEMEEIKKTGQVLIASSENETVTGVAIDFVRAYDYANDIIGYVTGTVGGAKRIIVYDIANDKFVYNEDMPAPITRTAFFINQNLFLTRRISGRDFTITKYTFPGLSFIASHSFKGDTVRLSTKVETNLDRIFLYEYSGIGFATLRKRTDAFVEEASWSTGTIAWPMGADANYVYKKRSISGDPLPYEMQRGTLNLTGFSTIYTYGAPASNRNQVVADNGINFISAVDNLLRVFNSSGTLLHSFLDTKAGGITMYPVGLTQNYITVISVATNPSSLQVYDWNFNFVRQLG